MLVIVEEGLLLLGDVLLAVARLVLVVVEVVP